MSKETYIRGKRGLQILGDPEVRASVKRGLIHSKKRPTMTEIPESLGPALRLQPSLRISPKFPFPLPLSLLLPLPTPLLNPSQPRYPSPARSCPSQSHRTLPCLFFLLLTMPPPPPPPPPPPRQKCVDTAAPRPFGTAAALRGRVHQAPKIELRRAPGFLGKISEKSVYSDFIG